MLLTLSRPRFFWNGLNALGYPSCPYRGIVCGQECPPTETARMARLKKISSLLKDRAGYYGVIMGFLIMGFLWGYYGVPMGFLINYGVPMGFLSRARARARKVGHPPQGTYRKFPMCPWGRLQGQVGHPSQGTYRKFPMCPWGRPQGPVGPSYMSQGTGSNCSKLFDY